MEAAMVGFKAHDEKHGDRLGRQVALGGVGMARRYVESGAIGEPERPVAERREVARGRVAMAGSDDREMALMLGELGGALRRLEERLARLERLVEQVAMSLGIMPRRVEG